MTPTYTQEGIAALKAGNRRLAEKLLRAAINQNPNDELAWLWLSAVVDTIAEKRVCLERILAINPNHEAAQRGLEILSQQVSKFIEPISSPVSPIGATTPQPLLSRRAVEAERSAPLSPPLTRNSSRRWRTVAWAILAFGLISVLGLIIVGSLLRRDRPQLAAIASATQSITQLTPTPSPDGPPTWTPTVTPAPTLTRPPFPTLPPQPPPAQLRPPIEEVIRIRELTPITSIHYELSSRINPENYLRDTSAQAAQRLGTELRALGLLKQTGSFEWLRAVDALNHQLAGIYYSIPEKTLNVFILPGGDISPEYPSIAYEYVRAMTDMHFGLDRLYSPDLSTDSSLAMRAMAEGDAMLTMSLSRWGNFPQETLDRFNDTLNQSESQLRLAGISSAVYRLRFFPYAESLRFSQRLYAEGGWDTVNQAYANVPTSSEQILHPEEYLATTLESPRVLSLPELIAPVEAGYELVVSGDTLGEYLLSLVLQEFDPDEGRAKRAAAGWDGDIFRVWDNAAGDQIYVLLSGWDTEDDAREFEEAAAGMLSRRTGAEPTHDPNLQERYFDGDPSVAYLRRVRDQVLVIWCSGIDLRDDILAALPDY